MKGIVLIFILNLWPIFGQRSYVGDQQNVFGQPLKLCSLSPLTGWTRNGYLNTDYRDRGLHTVCATMTSEFLEYTRSLGNDLITPRRYFQGLRPGDRWGLCASRWYQAYFAGKAPSVDLEASNKAALRVIPFNILASFDARNIVMAK